MKIRTVDAEKIREARGKNSREVVAHALRQRGHATDAKAIWRWETGKNQPSARVLPDLAEVLGLKIDDLFEEVTPPFGQSKRRDDSPLDRDDFEMLGALMSRLGASLPEPVQEEVRP
jgi:transcriptional regulator with XRE-family HTH domain